MFTGIVEEMGKIKSIQKNHQTMNVQIYANQVLEKTKIGDSIAVNGVCLTVTTFSQNAFSADVMPETFKATNLRKLTPGQEVNLERALQLQDRLGGHYVTGHVDQIGIMKKIYRTHDEIRLTISISPHLAETLIEKGSITVDGISLTIFNVGRKDFTVSIIPHTFQSTTLSKNKVGSELNIEADYIRKTNHTTQTITRDFLQLNGF